MPRFRLLVFTLVLLAMLVAAVAPAISADEHEPTEPKPPVEWDKDRPLTWEDFAGPVPNTAPEDIDAETVSGTRVNWKFTCILTFNEKSKKWTCKLNTLTFTAVAQFDPNTSWVRDQESQTPALLGHEQLHFDISEIFARKKRKQLTNLGNSGLTGMGATKEAATKDLENKLKKKIKKMCDDLIEKENKMQDKYDKETDHGRKPKEQEKWKKKVAQMLAGK